MSSNVGPLDEHMATLINEIITYKTHILYGRCEFTKSCWFCGYHKMGDVKRMAAQHMHHLLNGYFETTDGSVFVLYDPHNLVVQFNIDDKQPTMYISVNDEVKSSTHDVLDWAIPFWYSSLDSYPEKNISESVGEHARKKFSELKEKAS